MGYYGLVHEKNGQRKVQKSLTLATAILAAVILYLFSYGRFALELPAMKIMQITGQLSPDGYLKLAQIHIDLGQFQAAEAAVIEVYKLNQDPVALARLAQMTRKLGDSKKSEKYYQTYFKAGGKDPEFALEYGALLEKNNQPQEARAQYETAIEWSGESLPIRATGALVRLLMQSRQNEVAFRTVVQFHNMAENAKGYLNTERAQLEAVLGPKRANEIARPLSEKAVHTRKRVVSSKLNFDS